MPGGLIWKSVQLLISGLLSSSPTLGSRDYLNKQIKQARTQRTLAMALDTPCWGVQSQQGALPPRSWQKKLRDRS